MLIVGNIKPLLYVYDLKISVFVTPGGSIVNVLLQIPLLERTREES